jgi:hypothetical protein
MRNIRLQTAAALLFLYCATVVHAQQPQPTAAVPKLVRFSGSFRAANGLPAEFVEGVTLAVYRDQTGGNALWSEIQNVAVDADGHYSLLMGTTQNDGMPLELFSSGEPRWLGAKFNRPGEVEQPRVLLASVPYALKASDAETLGGRPASAYLLAGGSVGATTGLATSTTATTPVKPTKSATPVTSGMPNYIGKFANTTDLVDSAMYEVNGNIGIMTTNPLISLDARTGPFPQMGMAQTTDYLTFFASDTYGPAIYWDPAKDMRFGKGGSGLYNPFGFVEQMRIQSSTGNVGIGTMAPGSKLDVVGDMNFSGSVRYQGSLVLQVPGGSPGQNTALGLGALPSITTGGGNTAAGYQALASNTTGIGNTAVGVQALQSNTTGRVNTATGIAALDLNTTGNQNAAIGSDAMLSNTTGSNNTAVGIAALYSNTTGNNNIAVGFDAAQNVSGGNSYNIHIGNDGFANDNRTIRIGDFSTQTSFFAAGVRGITTTNNDAIPVMIDSAGQLGTVSSSRRFKEDIGDMGAASRDLMRLRPVTYRYKQPFADGSKPVQYGLIAEEVAEVYPDLVAHSADGQIETVKYQVLDSMLLNEVQRQQAEIGGQKDQIRRLEQRNQSLEERLAKLEAALASTSAVARVLLPK